MQGFVWSGLSLAGLLAGAFLGGRLVPVLLANGSRLAVRAGGRARRRGRVRGRVRGGRAARSASLIRSRERAPRRAGARLGRRRRGRRADRLRDRLGARRDGAAASGPGRPAARGAALVRAAAAERDRAAALAAERARADRPVPELRRPAGADRAARPARAAQARACARRRRASCACSARPAGSASRAAAGSPRTGSSSRRRTSSRARRTPRSCRSSGGALRAQAVAFDPHNDVAVLRVDGLDAPPLQLKDPHPGAAIAIVGYPLNGPLEASAGRIGETETVLAQDAYGEGPTRRVVTSLSGTVEHGNSGGPAVDASGAVQATVFAARATGERRLRRAGLGRAARRSPRRAARSRPAPAFASRAGRAPPRAA